MGVAGASVLRDQALDLLPLSSAHWNPLTPVWCLPLRRAADPSTALTASFFSKTASKGSSIVTSIEEGMLWQSPVGRAEYSEQVNPVALEEVVSRVFRGYQNLRDRLLPNFTERRGFKCRTFCPLGSERVNDICPTGARSQNTFAVCFIYVEEHVSKTHFNLELYDVRIEAMCEEHSGIDGNQRMDVTDGSVAWHPSIRSETFKADLEYQKTYSNSDRVNGSCVYILYKILKNDICGMTPKHSFRNI